jgi:ER membrane protein complex subunit 4
VIQAEKDRPAVDRKPLETDALKLKKAWEVALAPSKNIPMNAVMMYMSGNSLQIFSIMMVFMLFKGPIQGLIGTNAQFVKFETESNKAQLWGCKGVYVLVQLALLGLGVWKVNAMGLLPYVFFFCQVWTVLTMNRTTRSDWLAWEGERIPLERAFFAFG